MPIQFEENFTLSRWSAFSKRDIILAYHKLLWAVRRKIHVTEPLQHISKLSDLSTLGFPRSGDGEMAILPCNGIYGFREYLSPLLFAQIPSSNQLLAWSQSGWTSNVHRHLAQCLPDSPNLKGWTTQVVYLTY